ncbi:unnamed protein product [Effrenium voratum]|nr:unnamed protein product [Effrenium voratum]CAJ1435661.1 unnamed protein product [Effrenium voratum]
MSSVSPRLRELVKATARSLNRSWSEAEPFLSLLEENWYDTVESLRAVGLSELQALGIPLRFAKELLQLSDKSDARAPSSPARRDRWDDRDRDRGERGDRDRGDRADRGKGEGKGKGKGSSKSAPPAVESGKCYTCGGDHFARECPEKGKGKSKGKGKDGKGKEGKDGKGKEGKDGKGKEKGKSKKGKDSEAAQNGACFLCGGDHFARDCPGKDDITRPSQREFAYSHKIHFDIQQMDERFPLAARLIGKGGKNVKHITKTTGAWVWLCGRGSGMKDKNGEESDEPLHMVVKSDDQGSLEEAVQVAEDLVDTILDSYNDWAEAEGVGGDADERACYHCGGYGHMKRDCPEKGKGKGKGKREKGESRSRHWDEDRAEPAKRARH